MSVSLTHIVLVFVAILFPFGLQSQTVSIPDNNFEQALIDLEIDSDATVNGQILQSDAEAVMNLQIPFKQIQDLTGIEAFINLTILNCKSNQLSTLDVSTLSKLKELDFDNNFSISTVNWAALPDLEKINCSNSSVSNLDFSKSHLSH